MGKKELIDDYSDIFTLAGRGALTRDLLSALVELKGPGICEARDGEGQSLLMAYCMDAGVKDRLGAKDSVPGSGCPKDVVDYMLLNGADINTKDDNKNSILTRITENYATGASLRFFITRGADMYYAPNGWDTYIARSLRNNYPHGTWGTLQDFVDFSGDIKVGLPTLSEIERRDYPTPAPDPLTLMERNSRMSRAYIVALSMLLLAICSPEKDERLLSQVMGMSRAMGLRGISIILGQGGRLSPQLVKNLFMVINSMPPVKGSLDKSSEIEIAGFTKLITLGTEHCGPETVEFIKKHIGKKTLEKWIALEEAGKDSKLTSELAVLLRGMGTGYQKSPLDKTGGQVSF